MRRNKYNAKKVEIDGITFDSKAEAKRYGELKLLEKGSYIKNLEVHPRFILWAWTQDQPQSIGIYEADFRYYKTGEVVIEDVKCKATMTPFYKFKKKMMFANYGIKITEIMK